MLLFFSFLSLIMSGKHIDVKRTWALNFERFKYLINIANAKSLKIGVLNRWVTPLGRLGGIGGIAIEMGDSLHMSSH